VHARLAGRDHDLNFDGHTLDALECNRTDTRYHCPPSSIDLKSPLQLHIACGDENNLA